MPPSGKYVVVLNFFTTSTRNLLPMKTCHESGITLRYPWWGTDQLSDSGSFRAKIAQEKLIKESSRPYTIIHATQLFEFIKGIADISMVGDKAHLPPVLFQQTAADDVAAGIERIAVGTPVNGTVDIGGPEQ